MVSNIAAIAMESFLGRPLLFGVTCIKKEAGFEGQTLFYMFYILFMIMKHAIDLFTQGFFFGMG